MVIWSGDLDSQKSHHPEGMERLLRARAWAGRERYREVCHAKRHPLADSEQVRERSGIVEGTAGKGEKEEKGNLEHQPGYQLTSKEVIRTFGWMMCLDGGTLYLKRGERRVAWKPTILEANHLRAMSTSGQLKVTHHLSQTQPFRLFLVDPEQRWSSCPRGHRRCIPENANVTDHLTRHSQGPSYERALARGHVGHLTSSGCHVFRGFLNLPSTCTLNHAILWLFADDEYVEISPKSSQNCPLALLRAPEDTPSVFVAVRPRIFFVWSSTALGLQEAFLHPKNAGDFGRPGVRTSSTDSPPGDVGGSLLAVRRSPD